MKHSFVTFLLAGTILSFASMETLAQPTVPENAPGAEMHQKFDEAAMRQKMEEHQQKMADELNLTDEQRAKAKEINEKGRQDMEPMVKKMKNMREKMDEKRQQNMQEFENILTPEQKEKFESMKKQHQMKWMKKHQDRDQMGHKSMHHGPKMGPRGAKFMENAEPMEAPTAPDAEK